MRQSERNGPFGEVVRGLRSNMRSGLATPSKMAATIDGAEKLFIGARENWSGVQKDAKEGKVHGFELPAKVRLELISKHRDVASPNVLGVCVVRIRAWPLNTWCIQLTPTIWVSDDP